MRTRNGEEFPKELTGGTWNGKLYLDPTGGWWFATEDEDLEGPYETANACETAFERYGKNHVHKGGSVSVLDHGYVRLIDYMGNDLSIVRAARVSYDAAWRSGVNQGSDERLIHFLWNHRHTTPFEAVTITLEVFAPIFNFRQWHRHRTQSYNELSARYRELPAVFYLPKPEQVGIQSMSNKQARVIGDEDHSMREHREREILLVKEHCEQAFKLYRVLLEAGWPKELARIVLPFGTYSHMFATTNLLNLFRFLTLRSHEHAQYEIRVYAQAIVELIRPIVPVAVAAWENRLKEEGKQ